MNMPKVNTSKHLAPKCGKVCTRSSNFHQKTLSKWSLTNAWKRARYKPETLHCHSSHSSRHVSKSCVRSFDDLGHKSIKQWEKTLRRRTAWAVVENAAGQTLQRHDAKRIWMKQWTHRKNIKTCVKIWIKVQPAIAADDHHNTTTTIITTNNNR